MHTSFKRPLRAWEGMQQIREGIYKTYIMTKIHTFYLHK